MDTLLRRRMMIAVGGSPTPPPTPTYVPYIRGGGDGSYIDTGIKPDNTTKVIVWARNFNPGAGNLFGSRTSSTSNRFCLLTPGSANAGRIRIDYGDANDAYADDQFPNLSHYHKYEYYQGVLKIDDVLVASVNSQPTFTGTYNLYLFGNNNAGTLQSLNYPADICACQIYKGGTLVRDYTPVDSPSVGLYDSVSETVFANSGTGSFTYGTFNSSAYTPLEYIELSGQQYFDSGILGTDSLPFIVKYMSNGNSSWTSLFLAQTSPSSKRYGFSFGNDSIPYSRVYFTYNTGNKSYDNGSTMNGTSYVAVKTGATCYLCLNNTQVSSMVHASATFTTEYNIYIGGNNTAGTITQLYEGRLLFLSFGSQRNYVPAKVSGVAGMYDTYNDVFKASESGTPFVAGPDVATNDGYFAGRNISIIGDSISTFDEIGYKYDSYTMYYPLYDVTDVNQTYWKLLMNLENATLEENLSYSGSTVATRTSYPTLCDRIPLVGTCDTVFIALGTNDSSNSLPLGDYSYEKTGAELDESYFREAYIKGIKMIKEIDADIDIVCVILSMGTNYRDSIKQIAQHYGLKVIDCGSDYAKCQGVHPSSAGMIEIFRKFLFV